MLSDKTALQDTRHRPQTGNFSGFRVKFPAQLPFEFRITRMSRANHSNDSVRQHIAFDHESDSARIGLTVSGCMSVVIQMKEENSAVIAGVGAEIIALNGCNRSGSRKFLPGILSDLVMDTIHVEAKAACICFERID